MVFAISAKRNEYFDFWAKGEEHFILFVRMIMMVITFQSIILSIICGRSRLCKHITCAAIEGYVLEEQTGMQHQVHWMNNLSMVPWGILGSIKPCRFSKEPF